MKKYVYYVVFSYKMNNWVYNGFGELKRPMKIENYQDILKLTEDISNKYDLSGIVILNWKELGKTEDTPDQEELKTLRQMRHNIENRISLLYEFITENADGNEHLKIATGTALKQLELLKSLLP